MRRLTGVALGSLALLLGACGGAETIEGSGYAYELPDGWKEGTEEATETISPLADSFIQGDIVDDFATNINVIEGGSVPEGTDLRTEVEAGADLLAQGPERFGLPAGTQVEVVSELEETDLDGETAFEYSFETDTGEQVLLQRQITAVSPDGVGYTVTATSVGDAEDRDEAFDTVTASWAWE